MSIQQKRTAKIGLALSRIFKKTVQMHLNNSRPHGTHGTRSNMMNSTTHTGDNSVHTCLAPTLPSPALSGGIPDSQPAALHARLHHIARLRTTHAHSVSTATTQAGRAGKAQNRSAYMQAVWGCANARAGGQYMGARRGYGSPGPESASSASLSATNARRGRPGNANLPTQRRSHL